MVDETLEQKRARARARARAKAQRGQFEDIAKGAGRGLMQGVEGMAGLPGDVESVGGFNPLDPLGSIIRTGGNIGRATGVLAPDTRLPLEGGMMPTAEQISDARKEYVGDIAPPQTRAGEVAQTVGRYAPNAMMPGGPLARAANVLAPAAGEETAAEIARRIAPEWEDAFRLGGSIAGGTVSTQPTSTKFIKPSVREAQVNKAYRDLRNSGVRVGQTGTAKIGSSLRRAGVRAGMDPRIDDHKNMIQRVDAALADMRDPNGALKPLDFQTLQVARRRISEGYKIGEADNNRILRAMKDAFDEAVDNLEPRDFAGPNGVVDKAALDKWREARKLNTQFRKAEKMQELHDNAMNAVGANYTDAKYNTAVKQQLRALAKDGFKKAKYFNKDERNMILRAIRGVKEGGEVEDTKTIENLLRDFGKKWGGSGKMSAIQQIVTGTPAAAATQLMTNDPWLSGAVGVGVGVGMNALGNKAASMAEDIGMHKFNNIRNVVAGGAPQSWGPRKLPQVGAKVLPYTFGDEQP